MNRRAMKKLIIILTITLLASPAFAAQKYNPHTNKWETTSEDATIQYNPHDESWSYQQPGSKIEYNPHEKSWDWAPPSRDDKKDEQSSIE